MKAASAAVVRRGAWWRRASEPLSSRQRLFGSQVRGELERQSLVARQSLALRVHLESPFFQRRKDGCDSRVSGALDHRSKLSVLDLLEGPLQRIIDDRHIPIDPVVLVARTIVVMSILPEAVERQQLRFFDVRLAFRSAHVTKDVDCEATVAIPLPPHLKAEPDVAGFEDVRATVVFDGIAFGYEGFSGAGLHVRENALHRSEIGDLHNFFVAGALEHLRELLAEDADCPADGITIDDRIHAAMHAHAAADTVGGRQLRVIRTIDVASLDVEAIEAEQRGLLAAHFGRHVDGYTLVHMILDVAIPQLVSDDEGHAIGGKSGSL